MSLSLPLRGIIPPLITPLNDYDTLDRSGLEKLIEHVIIGGVHGIFILGTTGEGPSLSVKLKYEMIKESCAIINGRVPVLVGITDSSFVESVNCAKVAADCGADAVVLAPPFYFPAGEPELLEYLTDLVPELPLPLFLYNMPTLTKINFSIDLVKKASEIEQIVGIKDSSGSMGYFHNLRKIVADRPDFNILVGPEELLAETVLLGGHGGVNGGANLFPSLYVDLYNAAHSGEIESMRNLHEKVIDLSMSLYHVGKHSSSIIKGLKSALSIKGICSRIPARPFHPFNQPERDKVAEILSKLES